MESKSLNLEPRTKSIHQLYIRDLIKGILVFGAYLVTAEFGLLMDPVSGFATLIWPPSGIALAALLLYGFRFWPVIGLAAFLANYLAGAPFWATCGVATGNTLEALTGAWLLQYFVGFDKSMARIKDVFGLVFFAATLSTTISATIGVTSLALGHVKPFEGFGETWSAWWAGDVLGDILVAPMILVWATTFAKPRFKFWSVVEPLLLTSALALLCFLLFKREMRIAYLVFPLVVWSALRFGQLGCVTTVFVVSVAGVWGVSHGVAPIRIGTPRENLFILLKFLAVVSTTGMTLAASLAERRRALEKLKEREKQLLVSNEALRQTEAQLMEAIKSRDEFLSIASHELKTPVTSLSLHTELTEMEIDVEKNLAPSPKRLAEVFSISMKHINRLTSLIENLLDTSRIDAGKLGFSLMEMDLSKFIEESMNRFSNELARARCPVNLEIQENILIAGDASRLEQIMENVVSNIIKYASGSLVEISLKEGGLGARIVFEDSGPGIPKKKQAQLFQRFERGAASGAIAGIGLGLFIVKEIVKGHRGSVQIDSDTGRGMRLIIELPLKQDSGQDP